MPSRRRRSRPLSLSIPDPRSPAYLQDPYAQLKSLRDQAPCWVDPKSGLTFLLAYDEVGAGLTRITRGDDVFSIVIRAADAGEITRPEQILPFIHTLYLAGMHTTVHQTALSLVTLLGYRDQWGKTADEFDVTRPHARQHVAFGMGPHVCLGS
ncbi:hypothetical protein K2X89_10895 [Myxococcota bacterium]|nr:hypothetical protein [Myxococcota bacterium]